MMLPLINGCAQTVDIDKHSQYAYKSIPCSSTGLIKLSKEDTHKTKVDVIVKNHIPFEKYCM